MGARYTKDKFKLDIYAKYFDGYVTQGVGSPNMKVRGYYESSFRISYDFKTPACTGKQDATVYIDVNDAFGARQTEAVLSNNLVKIFVKPEVTAGVKITF